MKKLVALPLAVLFAAACSESTSPPTSSAVLSPMYGKSQPQPPPLTAVCDSVQPNCQAFEGGISTADYSVAGASGYTAPNGQHISSRLSNQSLVISPSSVPANFAISYRLYIIGTWDGDPKKGPTNIINWTWQCGTGPTHLLMNASFGNRLSSVTSYPNDITASGHFGGHYYNSGLSTLGFVANVQTAAYTGSGDVADSQYNIQRVISPGCTSGAPFKTTITGVGLPGPINEASWGIDNLSIVAQ